jgi:hypothetical protein
MFVEKRLQGKQKTPKTNLGFALDARQGGFDG